MRTFRRRFFYMLSAAATLTVIGTIGFLMFPEYDLSDALYMTVITLTAVGYEEVHDLTDTGRVLAGFLLAGGITLMGVWFALLTSALVEMDLAHVFLARRTMKRIDTLKGHFIVCGAGRTGRQIARELENAGKPYVVVEKDAACAAALREEYPEALTLEADATRDESLV
jgi:voltage-gated potassium channel